MAANRWTRRAFVGTAGSAGLWLPVLASCSRAGKGGDAGEPKDGAADAEREDEGDEPGKEAGEEEVSANEDLMREHGLLDRVLLVYEEAVRRLDAAEALPPDVIPGAAGLVRRFIEDYHEKLEEGYLFPRLTRAGAEAALVETLRAQHEAGRRLTEAIEHGGKGPLKDAAARRQVTAPIRSFIRMYRPHAAREDTVLFPAFRKAVSAHEYAALGEEFERKEHQLFGEDGFEKVLDEVATLEKALDIADLSRFTPA
jgi:hemerythrin-like domain-containing protein